METFFLAKIGKAIGPGRGGGGRFNFGRPLIHPLCPPLYDGVWYHLIIRICRYSKCPDIRFNFSCNVAVKKIVWGCHTIKFVAPNVAKVVVDSSSATIAHNVARTVTPGL